MGKADIYTPRAVVDELILKHDKKTLINPVVVTKINVGLFEVSISMDSSSLEGDLFRTNIRVYDKGLGLTNQLDITYKIGMQLGKPPNYVFFDSNDLLDILLTLRTTSKPIFLVYANRADFENIADLAKLNWWNVLGKSSTDHLIIERDSVIGFGDFIKAKSFLKYIKTIYNVPCFSNF
jgi:hypothetical protein